MSNYFNNNANQYSYNHNSYTCPLTNYLLAPYVGTSVSRPTHMGISSFHSNSGANFPINMPPLATIGSVGPYAASPIQPYPSVYSSIKRQFKRLLGFESYSVYAPSVSIFVPVPQHHINNRQEYINNCERWVNKNKELVGVQFNNELHNFHKITNASERDLALIRLDVIRNHASNVFNKGGVPKEPKELKEYIAARMVLNSYFTYEFQHRLKQQPSLAFEEFKKEVHDSDHAANAKAKELASIQRGLMVAHACTVVEREGIDEKSGEYVAARNILNYEYADYIFKNPLIMADEFKTALHELSSPDKRVRDLAVSRIIMIRNNVAILCEKDYEEESPEHSGIRALQSMKEYIDYQK